jgi:hypothetical protein
VHSPATTDFPPQKQRHLVGNLRPIGNRPAARATKNRVFWTVGRTDPV